MNTDAIERPALPPRAPGSARPLVRVEVNRTGLWHTVCEFDADDEWAEKQMRAGVEALASLDNATAFRVVAKGVMGKTLLNYSALHGWTLSK